MVEWVGRPFARINYARAGLTANSYSFRGGQFNVKNGRLDVEIHMNAGAVVHAAGF